MGRGRTGRIALRGAGVVLLALALSGCSIADVSDKLRFGWPRGITDQAERMRMMWTWSTVAALVVGVIVWGLMFWCVLRYRRRGDTLPQQQKYPGPIEVVYTVVPFLIIAVMFYYTAITENYVTKTPSADVNVTVLAFKWNWEFDYTDRIDPTTQSPLYTVGSATEIPVLVIPVGKSVKFQEKSNDVVHSFWVPEFLFKRDVFPVPQVNTFEITTTQTGSYVGRCAELCGTYHSEMNFEVRVVSPADYQRYLDALARFGNADLDRQSKALAAIGGAPRATTTHPFITDRTARSASDSTG